MVIFHSYVKLPEGNGEHEVVVFCPKLCRNWRSGADHIAWKQAPGMAKKSGFANMGVVKTRCVMIHFEGINIQHPA
jgi:hypothetical protein